MNNNKRKTPVKKKASLTKKPIKRPSSLKDIQSVDFEQLAKEYNLTVMQTKFAFFFVFVTNLNGPAAVELAGYSPGNYDDYDERTREYYETLVRKQQAKTLLDNPKVLTLITKLREDLNNQLIVDKLYVLSWLKRLVEDEATAGNVRLNALIKIGETMDMFGKREIIVDEREDPAKIAREAFERRKQQAKESPNIVEFKKEEVV
jgi:hypothetical protein